jgi:hypothetical protein
VSVVFAFIAVTSATALVLFARALCDRPHEEPQLGRWMWFWLGVAGVSAAFAVPAVQLWFDAPSAAAIAIALLALVAVMTTVATGNALLLAASARHRRRAMRRGIASAGVILEQRRHRVARDVMTLVVEVQARDEPASGAPYRPDPGRIKRTRLVDQCPVSFAAALQPGREAQVWHEPARPKRCAVQLPERLIVPPASLLHTPGGALLVVMLAVVFGTLALLPTVSGHIHMELDEVNLLRPAAALFGIACLRAPLGVIRGQIEPRVAWTRGTHAASLWFVAFNMAISANWIGDLVSPKETSLVITDVLTLELEDTHRKQGHAPYRHTTALALVAGPAERAGYGVVHLTPGPAGSPFPPPWLGPGTVFPIRVGSGLFAVPWFEVPRPLHFRKDSESLDEAIGDIEANDVIRDVSWDSRSVAGRKTP